MASDPSPTFRRRISPRTVAAAVLGLGGLAVTFYLLMGEEAFGPLLVSAVGFILLWPLRSVRPARPILLALVLVTGAYLFTKLAGVLAPFAVTFLLAYLLDPVVSWAKKTHNWSRGLTSGLLTAVTAGAVLLGAVFLVPSLLNQAQSLVSGTITLVMQLPDWVQNTPALDGLEEAGLIDRTSLVTDLGALLPGRVEAIVNQIPALATGMVKQIGTLIGLITTLALLPVLLFYSLRDFPELRDGLISLLPRYAGRREYLDRASHVFGKYIRGQLTISALSAVMVGVPLTLLGVPFSLLIGLLAGLLNMIPSLGSILTYIIGISLMLIFGSWQDVITVLIVLVIQALLEQAVLTPRIMGKQVGLNPVVILFALFTCSALFGFIGVLLAVPAAALLAGAIRAYREAFVLDLATDDADPLGD